MAASDPILSGQVPDGGIRLARMGRSFAFSDDKRGFCSFLKKRTKRLLFYGIGLKDTGLGRIMIGKSMRADAALV
jgi:hypothetical protein